MDFSTMEKCATYVTDLPLLCKSCSVFCFFGLHITIIFRVWQWSKHIFLFVKIHRNPFRIRSICIWRKMCICYAKSLIAFVARFDSNQRRNCIHILKKKQQQKKEQKVSIERNKKTILRKQNRWRWLSLDCFLSSQSLSHFQKCQKNRTFCKY